ncbi:TRAP transporter small permease [Gammaproteobacteria bacterium]|jgi:C4-dicarboxylate transporter DctQ subunit|nr:TRAP transporter small permease [Gammaproteobacteria bacterium]
MSKLSRTDNFEETLIAILFGIMTVATFSNVIARYIFNDSILWALELTVFLFAWMVLLGASYAIKKNAHLGVDILINMLSPQKRRILGLIAVFFCLLFSFLMLKGSWDYWANFANLPATEGRWFPLGFEENYRDKGWYEVNDIPMPYVLSWMEGVFNEGEEYEKIPRLIPYLVLPLSMFLILFRFLQAGIAIYKGDQDRLIANHEAEGDIDSLKEDLKEMSGESK